MAGRWVVVVVAWGLVLSACGGDDGVTSSDPGTDTTASDASSEGTGTGRALDAGVLEEPPAATGDLVTAEQAEGVSRSVITAWMRDDRETADRFAAGPDALDDLFARVAPSQELSGDDDEGYCSEGDDGGFTGCSYTVVDDSHDGILAVSTELEIVDGLVLVRSAGFADWND